MKRLIPLFIMMAACILIIYAYPKTTYVVYDCGMAEWHPDIPPKVKEECRKRALEQWREQQRSKTVL